MALQVKDVNRSKRVPATCKGCGIPYMKRPDTAGYCTTTCSKKGKNNPNFKEECLSREDHASYVRHHQQLAKVRGKASSCIFGCLGVKYEWANFSGDYEDIWDYLGVCKMHHEQLDHGKIEWP